MFRYTLGGTISSMWSSFNWANLAHTVLLAMVGAAVSYLTSRLLLFFCRYKP